MVTCNVDQAPPRPVTQQWCGNDHLKPAGFCPLASHRHTSCSFRVEPCLPEDGLQSASESSSLTIRIRASSGTLSFKLVEGLVLSVAVGVCLLRPMALRLSFV